MSKENTHFKREEDGTTYWVFGDEWVCAPTRTAGGYDENCIRFVCDLEFENEQAKQELFTDLKLFSMRF